MKKGFALIRAKLYEITQRLSLFPDPDLSLTKKDGDEILRAPTYCNPNGYLVPADQAEEKQ